VCSKQVENELAILVFLHPLGERDDVARYPKVPGQCRAEATPSDGTGDQPRMAGELARKDVDGPRSRSELLVGVRLVRICIVTLLSRARRDAPLTHDPGERTMNRTTVRRRITRIAAAAGTLGALWFAAAAPFFQGPRVHW